MAMLDGAVRARPETAAKVIDGEAILINLETGVYYSLEAAGAEIWALIERGLRLREVCRLTAARWGVAPAVVEADVDALAQALVTERLVEPAPPVDAVDPLPDAVGAPALPYRSPVLRAYRDMADLLALDPPAPSIGALGRRQPV